MRTLNEIALTLQMQEKFADEGEQGWIDSANVAIDYFVKVKKRPDMSADEMLRRYAIIRGGAKGMSMVPPGFVATFKRIYAKRVSPAQLKINEDSLTERAAFPPGTVRNWSSGTVVKLNDGRWIAARGNLKPAQYQDAVTELSGHDKRLDGFLNDLKEIAPQAQVKGRVKELQSALGKLKRKPSYGMVSNMQDLTGSRIIHKDSASVKRTVAAIRKKFKVVEESDYITNPQSSGYRSHHLIVEDQDGKQKEIQVRTAQQERWAKWAHKVYKPRNAKQARAVRKHGDKINDFANKLSAALADRDSGDQFVSEPECPPYVADSFGCP